MELGLIHTQVLRFTQDVVKTLDAGITGERPSLCRYRKHGEGQDMNEVDRCFGART